MTIRQKVMEDLPDPYNKLAIIRAEDFRVGRGRNCISLDEEREFSVGVHIINYCFMRGSTPERYRFWSKVIDGESPHLTIRSVKDIKRYDSAAKING